MLELRGVTAGYGRARVLNSVDLTVSPGTISVLIGPNGAGKSTVLKTVFGIVPPWRGTISFEGELLSPTPASSLQHRISYIPQGRCNFPQLTVEENLRMAAYTRRDTAVVRQDIARIYEKYEALAQSRNKHAGLLSGGQQQILETAMSMLLHPRLVLVDEPSIGLAPIMVKQILGELVTLAESGCSVLMVEQNVAAAMKVADHVSVLELGAVKISGTPAEVLSDPKLRRLYLGAGSHEA